MKNYSIFTGFILAWLFSFSNAYAKEYIVWLMPEESSENYSISDKQQTSIKQILSDKNTQKLQRDLSSAGITRYEALTKLGAIQLSEVNGEQANYLQNLGYSISESKKFQLDWSSVPGQREFTESNSSSEEIPWGIQRIKADKVWTRAGLSGAPLCLIGSGLDLNHPEYRENLIEAKAFGEGTLDALQSVGTAAAGIAASALNNEQIVGVGPRLGFRVAAIFSGSGSSSDFAIVQAMEWCLEEGSKVVVVGFGGRGSDTMRRAFNAFYNAGGLSFAEVGRQPTDLLFPAAYDSVIAVAKTDINNQVVAGSPSSDGIELAAPGADILTTTPGGGIGRVNGYAAIHAAAAAAVLFEVADGFGNAGLRQVLRDTALDIGDRGFDPLTGYGLVDMLAAYESLVVYDDFPYADFSFAVDGLNAAFTDKSGTTPPGSITSWQWDFGDGQFSSEPSPRHRYQQAGTYTVTLEVTNSTGLNAIESKVVTVEKPMAELILQLEITPFFFWKRITLIWNNADIDAETLLLFQDGRQVRRIDNDGEFRKYLGARQTSSFQLCNDDKSLCSNIVSEEAD